ncbi:DUF2637 domain-containing protein [Streptomyces sp. NBC_01565]|uniref:DUF2637 domain-containing protein n=1 Tax=Streptomyces sp. NBC_01565 TaxID=2975881 RepID=UPI00225A61A4|nr:DUF2637 domain-containing protein [Streptomyces sp. NBC_01565]MCX4547256.1 DUF2637 domain-containing protein [Streptomyces sp. NBC_01565]
MTTTLEPGVHVPAPTRTETPSRTPDLSSPTPAEASPTFADDPAETDTEPKTSRHLWLMIPLAVVAVLAGLTAAGVGFALSYGALRSAAVAWGFGTGWQSYAFPLGVDGLIIALYTADLVLAWRQMARPWVRMTAHALTAVTIALNVSAAIDGMPGAPTLSQALEQDFGRLLGHAMMPIAYVILTEVARWAIARTARLEAGLHADQALTLAEWALNFRVTWRIFQHAKTHPATYADARTFARDLAIYRVWQKERALYATGTAEDRASVLDRMPALLAPYGVSVERARAIPAEMLEQEEAQEEERQRADRRREEERKQQQRDEERADQQRKRERQQEELAEQRERERQEREDAHQARMDALAKEAEETRQQGELAELRATVGGQSRAAAHRAEAAVATAEIQAATATTAAQRAAEEATRRAAAEEAAEQSAKVAAERAKETAELAKLAAESAKVAEAQRQKNEADRLAAEESAKEQAARAKLAEESAKLAAAEQQTAEAKAAAAEARERAGQANLRAAEAEDLAGMSQRPRKIRRAARMLIDSVPAEEIAYQAAAFIADHLKATSPITGADIGAAIGINSPGAASEYRTEALALIARGYNHHTGYDPDRTIQQQ